MKKQRLKVVINCINQDILATMMKDFKIPVANCNNILFLTHVIVQW